MARLVTAARALARRITRGYESTSKWVIAGWTINAAAMLAVVVWSDYLPVVPTPPQWVGAVVGGASISTTFLLGRKITFGWIIMICNQAGWGWVALSQHQTGLVVSTLFFLGLGIHNLRLWIKYPPIRNCDCPHTCNAP